MPATQRELDFAESLEIHTERMIKTCESTIVEFRKVRNNDNRQWINSSIKYYEHCISAYQWSLGIAKEKAKRK